MGKVIYLQSLDPEVTVSSWGGQKLGVTASFWGGQKLGVIASSWGGQKLGIDNTLYKAVIILFDHCVLS